MSVERDIARVLERLRSDDLGAIVRVRYSALAEARAADDALAHGAWPRPLEGLAFTAKAVLATAGLETTAASAAFLGNVPDVDAGAVARLRDAGAVLVGKTNCSELALSPSTRNPLFPETRHPKLAGMSPGGSSGGCAAAVAAGYVPVSLGTDYGGSLRFPAACCGVVALRPTPGRIPAQGQVPPPPPASPRARFSLVGPIAATAAVLARAFGALALVEPPAARLPDRVAFLGGSPAVGPVAAAFRRAGVPATAVGPEWFDEASELFSAIRALDDFADLRPLAAQLGLEMQSIIAAAPNAVDVGEQARLSASADELRERVARFFDDYDLLVAPIASAALPPPTGAPVGFDALRPCRAVSLVELPVVSMGGVQLIGRRGHDEEVIAAALALDAL